MEQYIVSARKYRPQTFKSVVGQEALTTTLKNAIASNHLAHAYLFCGPRGVGKTTCARIFAKTINCSNLTADGEPCNECESCRAFNEQRSFNIHELDAASNNSVDDIRTLVEQVQVLPQIGHYSVYIIDEVHMLSTAAFNAFLKTLEEPPHHAIFILATTEKHKIIPTILSRCQIYDFNRIKVTDTVNHLRYVANSEGITAEDAALNVIAHKADGAMRDALSIFDQIVSFCGNNITYQDAINNLNVLDYDYYFRLVDLLLEGNVPESLVIFDQILAKGFDGQHFVGGLATHLRDVMVSKSPETIQLLEVGDSIAPRYKEQAAKTPTAWLYSALDLANECDYQYRTSRNKRLLVELMLIKISGLATDNSPKKAKPELPFITAVAPSPVSTQQQATAPLTNQQNHHTATKDVHIVRLDCPIDAEPAKTTTTPSPTTATQQQNQPQQPINQNSNASFTQQQLIEHWNNYATSLEKETHTTSTMLNFPPVKIDNNNIRLTLVNNIQLEFINNHRQRIETFLSQNLHNTITLTTTIDETITKTQAFTPEEKFRKMQERNAAFAQLRRVLGLEIV